MLKEWQESDDLSVVSIGLSMQSKFEKYWGDPEKMNTVIFLVNILDPRDKLEYMEYSLKQMYGDDKGLILYAIGNMIYLPCLMSILSYMVLLQSPLILLPLLICLCLGNLLSLMKAKFKKHNLDSGGSFYNKKSELEIYLSEEIVEEDNAFDVLRWWKINS